MKFNKKIVSIILVVYFTNILSVLESRAFFTCTRNECRKKTSSNSFQSFNEIDPGSNTDSNSSNSGPSFNSGSSGSSPINPHEGASGGSNIGFGLPSNNSNNSSNSQLCSINLQKFENHKSYVMCLLNSTKEKMRLIIALIEKLNMKLEQLIKIMKEAPVCTGWGYTLEEYLANHAIFQNLDNLKNIYDEILELEKKLKDIVLACNACDDPAQLEIAIQLLNEIINSLNQFNNDFNNEISNIKSRYESFFRTINDVIANHGTSPLEIMAECGVTLREARIMSRKRIRALKAFIRYVQNAELIFASIESIQDQKHGCVLNPEPDPLDRNEQLVNACVSL